MQLDLKPGQFVAVDFPADATVSSLTVRAQGGRVELALQSSKDGQVWSSPFTNARVASEERRLALVLKEGVRRLRVLAHNSSNKTAFVEIDEIE